jgi:hypothetical protein
MDSFDDKKMIWAIIKKKGEPEPEHYYKKISLKNYDFYLLHKGNFEHWDYKKTKEGIMLYSKKPILINPSLSGWEPDPKKYCRFLRKLPLTERKWSSIQPPKTKSGRKKILQKYGPYAFLDPENLKYPIISKKGEFSPKGLLAAYRRARQWGDDEIAELAEEIGKCMGLSWAKMNPSKLISIWFDRRFWTLRSARKWLKDFGFQYHDYIRTKEYYKFPQIEFDKFQKFEMKDFGDGIKGIVGVDEEKTEINPIDTEQKEPYNKYMELYKKYLKEADELLEKENLSQASEKYWGAVAEILKMIAEKRGWHHKSHHALANIVYKLQKERPQIDLLSDFSIAEQLHINFYENYKPYEWVKKDSEAVKRLISNLKRFL